MNVIADSIEAQGVKALIMPIRGTDERRLFPPEHFAEYYEGEQNGK